MGAEVLRIVPGIKQIVCENIKRLLERDGLSQRALAKKIGVTEGAVSKWVKGINWPGDAELDMMIEKCHWTADELINGSNSSIYKFLKMHNESDSPLEIKLK